MLTLSPHVPARQRFRSQSFLFRPSITTPKQPYFRVTDHPTCCRRGLEDRLELISERHSLIVLIDEPTVPKPRHELWDAQWNAYAFHFNRARGIRWWMVVEDICLAYLRILKDPQAYGSDGQTIANLRIEGVMVNEKANGEELLVWPCVADVTGD